MNKALLEHEKNFSRAREAARLQNMRLATTSHDIRQPITSLRTTMAVVTKDQPRDVQKQLNAAFDYLDQLEASYVDEQQTQMTETPSQGDQFGSREMVSSEVIASTLVRMFQMEAENKGLGFEVETEEAQLCVQPLAVTRILSNLFSRDMMWSENSGPICCHPRATIDAHSATEMVYPDRIIFHKRMAEQGATTLPDLRLGKLRKVGNHLIAAPTHGLTK